MKQKVKFFICFIFLYSISFQTPCTSEDLRQISEGLGIRCKYSHSICRGTRRVLAVSSSRRNLFKTFRGPFRLNVVCGFRFVLFFKTFKPTSLSTDEKNMWRSQRKNYRQLTAASCTLTWCCLTMTKAVCGILGCKSWLWRRVAFCLVFLAEDTCWIIKRTIWERCCLCDFSGVQCWGGCGWYVCDVRMVTAFLTWVEVV